MAQTIGYLLIVHVGAAVFRDGQEYTLAVAHKLEVEKRSGCGEWSAIVVGGQCLTVVVDKGDGGPSLWNVDRQQFPFAVIGQDGKCGSVGVGTSCAPVELKGVVAGSGEEAVVAEIVGIVR